MGYVPTHEHGLWGITKLWVLISNQLRGAQKVCGITEYGL
jgi:hypothetical protein